MFYWWYHLGFLQKTTECIKYHLQNVFKDFDLDLDFRLDFKNFFDLGFVWVTP